MGALRFSWLGAGLVACAAPPAIEMVDVTPVWPLLTDDDLVSRGFIDASTVAAHGVVFPRDVFDSTPPLTRVDEPDTLYANLVVVGARIDACFQEGFDDPPCEASVRLVLQPILPSPLAPELHEARDASIHAFYVVDDPHELLNAIATLATARVDRDLDGTGPLRVSPLLMDDAGRAQVRDVLLRLLGGDRLVRVTSMEVHGDNTAWTFAGFAINELGSFSNADEVFAQHVLSVGTEGVMQASVDPELAAGPENYTLLIDDEKARAATLAERQAAFDAAARVENPLLHNSGTLDCVSCHLAATARATALAREELAASPDAFVSERYDITPSRVFTNTQLIHNLGYRFTTLALSPRLMNETALTAARADAALHPERR